jgi:hypothetical protein
MLHIAVLVRHFSFFGLLGFGLMFGSILSQTVKYSQAASTTTSNLLNGTNLQYLGKPSKLTVWAAAYLAAALDSFSLSYSMGADFVTLVPANSTINNNASGPQQLNDLVGAFAIPGGANLVLALTSDATSSTHTGAFRFQIES